MPVSNYHIPVFHSPMPNRYPQTKSISDNSLFDQSRQLIPPHGEHLEQQIANCNYGNHSDADANTSSYKKVMGQPESSVPVTSISGDTTTTTTPTTSQKMPIITTTTSVVVTTMQTQVIQSETGTACTTPTSSSAGYNIRQHNEMCHEGKRKQEEVETELHEQKENDSKRRNLEVPVDQNALMSCMYDEIVGMKTVIDKVNQTVETMRTDSIM